MADGEEKTISMGKIVRREHISSLPVPKELIGRLTGSYERYLAIFSTRGAELKISVVPCPSREILKIVMQLSAFLPSTVKTIADIVYSMKLKTVHTSGMCFGNEECCYEAYIEQDGSIDLPGLREKFLKVPGCLSVQLYIVEMEDA